MTIDGSGTSLATCVLAPNPSPMTLEGTNTWLIAAPGSSSALVVDPGPEDEEHPYYGSWFLKGSGVFDAEEALIKFMATHELT